MLSDVIVPDAMIKDDWTDRPDKDSDGEDSTQVGQGHNIKVNYLHCTLQWILPYQVPRVCDSDLIVLDKEFL